MPENTGQAQAAPQTAKTPEEAILGLLGDEEEPEEKPENEQEEPQDEEEPEEKPEGESEGEQEKEPSYKVKIDGEEIEVPLSELTKGYQRQADYTRKTQKIAEERRRIQQELETVTQERVKYSSALETLEKQLSGPEPDWETLKLQDPVRFADEFTAYHRRKQALEAIKKEQEAVQKLAELQQQAVLERRLAEEKELLTSAIPEWVDKERADKEREALVEYGRKAGFSDEELSQIYDHRAVVLLRKAWLYDQAREQAEQTKKSAPKVKTAQPGTAQLKQTRVKEARARLTKTGSLEDAAAVLESML